MRVEREMLVILQSVYAFPFPGFQVDSGSQRLSKHINDHCGFPTCILETSCLGFKPIFSISLSLLYFLLYCLFFEGSGLSSSSVPVLPVQWCLLESILKIQNQKKYE